MTKKNENDSIAVSKLRDSMSKSCLSCRRWVTCKDPDKGSSGYYCRKYEAFNEATKGGALRVFRDDFLDPSSSEDSSDTFLDIEELDIVSMLEKARDPDTKTIRDAKIDDSDIPRANNFFHYCTTMLGKDARLPFARQMWIAYTLFAEACPRCSDPEWKSIENVPVNYPTKDMQEHVQFFEKGKCPKCKATRGSMIHSKELNFYGELDACVGQRGGKSTVTSTMASYLLHCYLKLPKLSAFCEGIQDSSPLTATFVGVRATDAYNLLWTPVIKILDASPWFQQYHEMLKYNGNKLGKELYKKKDVFLRYEHKNIEMYPSGPTKRGLRGRTRFLGAIDELGWFPVKKHDPNDTEEAEREHADAEEVYTALDRSLATIRTELLDVIQRKEYNTLMNAFQINISSPSSKKDKLFRLMEANRNSNEALSIHLATWEMSPRFTRDNPIIVKAYENNPITAERDYGANPPAAAFPFIESVDAIKKCFTGKNTVGIVTADREAHGKSYRAAKIGVMHPLNEIPPSILSIDAGYNNNSFALTIGFRKSVKVVVPVLIEVQPGRGNVIHYNALYEKVISPLIKAYNVKFVFADRWQSISILHRIQDEFGIESGMYSVKMPDFNLTRSKLEAEEFSLPSIEKEITDNEAVVNYPSAFFNSPAAHLFFQMKTVSESGKTVIKGDGYTDDLFRSLVLLSSKLFDPKIEEKISNMSVKKRNSVVIGIVRSKNGVISDSSRRAVRFIAAGSRTPLY